MMWGSSTWRRKRHIARLSSAAPTTSTTMAATATTATAAVTARPSVESLMQLSQQLDRRAPITLSIVVLIVASHIHNKQITLGASLLTGLLNDRAPLVLLHDPAFLHEVLSFGWTGYWLEQQLGGLRFVLVLAHLVVLAQLLRVAIAFVLARALLLHTVWRIEFASVLWALKVVLARQQPARAATLSRFATQSRVTSSVPWLELLGVYVFVPHTALLVQTSGLAAGYAFTVLPGMMALVVKCEHELDCALRKCGIAVPSKNHRRRDRWRRALRDAVQQLRSRRWWPQMRRRGDAGAGAA